MFYKFVNEYKDKVYEGHSIRRFFDEIEFLVFIFFSITIAAPFLFSYFFNRKVLPLGIFLTIIFLVLFIFIAKWLYKDSKNDPLSSLSTVIKKNNYDNRESMKWLIEECSTEIEKYKPERRVDVFQNISIGIAALKAVVDSNGILSLESIVYLGIIAITVFFIIPISWKIIDSFDNQDYFYKTLLTNIKYYYCNCSYNKNGKISKKQRICVQFNENAIESNSNENNE